MMKKVALLISAIVLLMASCGQKESFTIEGSMPNAEYVGQTVYLQTLDSAWRGMVNIDTAIIDVNGKFKFMGLAKEGPVLHFIRVEDVPRRMRMPVAVVIEPGKINITVDSISIVGGTKLNDAYQSYMSKSAAINGEMRDIYMRAQKDTANTELQKQLEQEFEAKANEMTQVNFDFTKANIGNQIGAYYFLRNSGRFSTEQNRELLAEMKPEYKENKGIQSVEKRLEVLEATAVGKTFTDLKAKTPDGKDIALSDYAGKGKYVLVDFWAAWCPPCRAEMPKLVEIYKKYKDKGFEIVGISLDKDGEAWIKGIKDLNITWPQISDLKYWDSELSRAYGVNSIPHTVLIDKDGKIIERGLNAEKVEEKLAELLK